MGGFKIDKKNNLIGLWIISGFVIIFEIWYHLPLLTGSPEYVEPMLELTAWSAFVWFNLLLSAILIISVTYGFYKHRNWARLYIIFYFCYSSFWAFMMMFVMRPSPWAIYLRFGFLVFYVIVIVYMLMSWVKNYFVPSSDDFLSETVRCYRYGDYSLYKTERKLKNGSTRTMYFFSKGVSTKGQPCSLPDEYTVGINKKTGMPYLKKKK